MKSDSVTVRIINSELRRSLASTEQATDAVLARLSSLPELFEDVEGRNLAARGLDAVERTILGIEQAQAVRS